MIEEACVYSSCTCVSLPTFMSYTNEKTRENEKKSVNLNLSHMHITTFDVSDSGGCFACCQSCRSRVGGAVRTCPSLSTSKCHR